MNENRPPEGRRSKHGKPLIPASNRPVREPYEVAKVGGMRVMRRPIFQTGTDRQHWWVDMLVAVHAAKQLGIEHFEVTLEGNPVRPATPKPTGFMVFSMEGAEDAWKKTSESITGCLLTVYAHVVE